jgi:TonB family protein
LEVLKTLRSDPATKEYGGANNLDTPLQVVSHQKPIFPRQLQGTHREGSATVEFYVGKDGRVLLPRAISATEPAFGYSACQSVAAWRFNAPLRNGKPVVVRARIPINYSLNTPPAK